MELCKCIHKVEKQETINNQTSTYNYTYDDNGKLTQVKKDNIIVESYTYDNNGNRLSSTVNGITTTASYTLDDQIEVYGDNTYTYDNDGYLQEKVTPDGTTSYIYSTLGELKEVTTPTKTITYKHNANNQRVSKLIDGVITEKYLWSNLTTLLAIYDKDDNLVQRFEYAYQRMPISFTQNSTKYYLHYDQVGSLRAVSDTNHNIIKEIVYDTYGNILIDTNPSMKIPFGFAGGLYDSDTQLTRFGYRDYDSYTGKWTAKDPIDFSGGDSNLYGYVLGDPVGFIDPFGLCDMYAGFMDRALYQDQTRYERQKNAYEMFDKTSNIGDTIKYSGVYVKSPLMIGVGESISVSSTLMKYHVSPDTHQGYEIYNDLVPFQYTVTPTY